MKIEIKQPHAIVSFIDWGESIYINGKSPNELFGEIKKVMDEKEIKNPIMNLTITAEIYDSEEKEVKIYG